MYPIAYIATNDATPTTMPTIVDGHLSLCGTFRDDVTVPVGTIVDLSLEANGPYFEPPTTSAPAVLSIVREQGDGKGGWSVSLRAASAGDSKITASHHHGRCPGPVAYGDYSVVVHVTQG
jgi:hypothetical protein